MMGPTAGCGRTASEFPAAPIGFGALIWPVSSDMEGCILQYKPAGPKDRIAMTTFDKREEGFEKKFAHDQEMQFRAAARRNRLLGLWAAELMGKSGSGAQDYARTVVESDLQKAGDDDVLEKVRTDLAAAGVPRSDHQIRRVMDDLMAQAVKEIAKETH